jgi:hypothetical protein
MGHIVRQNDITGISTVQSQFTNPIICCVHARGIQGMDFCENTFDQSVHGFHFLSQNNINVRNNHINNHSIGLEINTGDARIGKQIGHGNEWNLDPNACVLYAASVSNGDPLFSEFVVPEGNVLPWLPPNVKLFPDPSTLFWFYNDATAPLDYCEPMLSPLPRLLTPYEKEVVLGTSSLSGVALWDLTRDVYAKLLIFPALRPTGSPEETFFNSLNGSTLASLANVVQQIRNALIHTSTYESTLATYTTAIDLAFTNLGLFELYEYQQLDGCLVCSTRHLTPANKCKCSGSSRAGQCQKSTNKYCPPKCIDLQCCDWHNVALRIGEKNNPGAANSPFTWPAYHTVAIPASTCIGATKCIDYWRIGQ